MIGAADGYRASIHVDDAASAVVAALDAPAGAYNVADEPITNGEWNAAFAAAFGFKKLRATPRPGDEARRQEAVGPRRQPPHRLEPGSAKPPAGRPPTPTPRSASGRGRRPPGGVGMTRLRQVALVVIAGGTGVVGLWATASPESFYDDFPGMGRVWVAVDGPYNEHLVRDVGGLNLASRLRRRPRRSSPGSTAAGAGRRRRGAASTACPHLAVPRHPPRPLRHRRQGRPGRRSLGMRRVLAAVARRRRRC